jgi:hypothetical protein
MGMVILLSDDELWQRACDSMGHLRPGSNPDAIPIAVILLWACIGATHDAAYLSEKLSRVTDRLAVVANRFRVAFDPMPSERNAWDWPNDHHAVVGGRLWRRLVGATSLDARMADTIASAIERHDSSICTGRVQLASWASFLAVLCDELQDWHREPRETPMGNEVPAENPWRRFSLELFRLDKDKVSGATTLSLAFAVQDYPPHVIVEKGSAGTKVVEGRFVRILKTLRANLEVTHPWRIELTARFSSRGNATATSGGNLDTA